ncbi:MAG: hypothetical protein GTN78_19770 [Gemmatimonadales bacterium]|nr:hypothetical protein [Gemmatimonadales bacterium]NIN12612.1 hypothetical protein [Gemmatimonadales bacterium]NIR02405.1 hypothetical protein [Gemmatimonadales bacterium]NIS66196.1 hypothetical protein [Gemmatimonadales bacterium]
MLCQYHPGRAMWVGVGLVALGLFGSACDAGDGAGNWAGIISDSAGVTVVANPAEGLWPNGEHWRVVQDLLIGQAEGDPDYMFGRIAGICVGSDGSIYVVDQLPPSIRVYSEDGTLLRTFGRGGAGPGEQGSALGPCLMGPGDTLAVPDLQNSRVSRFAPNGSVVSLTSFDIRSGIPVRWDVSDDGRPVVQLRFLGIVGEAAAGTPDAVAVLERDGSFGDTLLRFPSGTGVTMTSTGPKFTLAAADPVWTPTGEGGILYGYSDEYRITRYDSNGIPQLVLTKPFRQRPVTELDQRAMTEGLRRVFQESLIENVMGTLLFAEFYPAYFRMRLGPRGSLWVQQVLDLSTLSEDEHSRLNLVPEDPEVFLANPRLAIGAPDWDVFDPQGRFLGVVTLPARFEAVQFVGDAIYGIWRDEADVEYVMRVKVVMEGQASL